MLGSLSKKIIWGLYIGQTSINAVKVSRRAKELVVEGFDTIEYAELPSAHKEPSETEPIIRFKPSPARGLPYGRNITDLGKLIEEAIRVFLARNQINRADSILISLPSQFVLSRFVNLPAVKKTRLREIVRFEVEKHIPLDIKDIIWDFHMFCDKPVPGKEVEVGIFAIKKEDMQIFLSSLTPIKDHLTTIQIGAVALYNFVTFYKQITDPTILIEVKDDNTNLMIIDDYRFWIRSIPSTGIDIPLIEEIKRSIGYYKSLVKEIALKHLILLGDIQEDKKNFFLGHLNYELKEISFPEKMTTSIHIDKDRFSADIPGFCIPLGIAMQGLSLARININLIPEEFSRRVAITSKKNSLLCASLIILFGVLILFFGQRLQNKRLLDQSIAGLDILNNVATFEKRYKGKENIYKDKINSLEQIVSVGQARTFWVKIIPTILQVIPEEASIFSLKSRWEEKTLIVSINGKSFNPRLGFINEAIKTPFEKLIFLDNENKESPMFENVEVVPGSIQHDEEGISFEITLAVKWDTLLKME